MYRYVVTFVYVCISIFATGLRSMSDVDVYISSGFPTYVYMFNPPPLLRFSFNCISLPTLVPVIFSSFPLN